MWKDLQTTTKRWYGLAHDFQYVRKRVLVTDYFFFFQAEDGIRDYKVTGVQTCALPISRPLLGMFITDEQVLVLAIELLYIVLWSGLLLGCFIALSSIMRASGDVVIPTAITITVLAVLELPMAWWLSRGFGLMGIWMALPLSYTLTLCLQTAYYKLVWKKRPIRRMV